MKDNTSNLERRKEILFRESRKDQIKGGGSVSLGKKETIIVREDGSFEKR